MTNPKKKPNTKETQQSNQKVTNKCAVCALVLLPTTIHVQCDSCKKWSHPNCVGLSARDVKANAKDGRYEWFCRACSIEMNGDDASDAAYLRNAIKTILKRLDAIERKQSELERSQEFLGSQHDAFGAAMRKCNESTSQLRSDLVAVTKNCSVMQEEVDCVKSQQNTEIQKKVANTVLIRGAKMDDDPSSVVQKIATLLNKGTVIDKVESAKRIAHDNKEPVIVVKFTDGDSTREFVRDSKRKRISTHCIGYTGERKPIYVDEQLTRDTFLLFKYAKKLKKIGFLYVWISSGDIMARKNSTSPFIRIKNRAHVDSIERDLLLSKQSNASVPIRSKSTRSGATRTNGEMNAAATVSTKAPSNADSDDSCVYEDGLDTSR